MRRGLLAALLGVAAGAGCLVPGASPLSALDTQPPVLLEIQPPVETDGGYIRLPAAATLSLTFSEPMDPSSLRPGIVFRTRGVEQPLNILAPETGGGVADRDVPWTVRLQSGSSTGAFPDSNQVYSRLVLRTLLLDAQGNAIALDQGADEQEYLVLVPAP